MASGDATAIPVKNQAYRCVFPILDADGDLVTGATGLDSEVSKDQGTFADATSEATEIATSSGIYYLDLTATEMNADCVAVIVKTTSSGAKTTVLVFYPQEAGDINVDVTYWNGTAVATPTTGGVPEVDVTHWLGTAAATPTVAGVPEVDLTHVGGATTNVAALATNVDAILTDTSTTLDDLVDGLESELAKVPKSDSTVTWNATALASIQQEATDALNAYDPPTRTEATSDANSILAAVDAVDNFVDTEVGALTTELAKVPKSDSNVTWNATALASINAEADTALADYDGPTNSELATALGTADDAVLAAIAALQLFVDTEVAAILADTNELQTDWVNGGRLDLLIDGIKAKTDSLTFTVANQVDANAVAVSGDATAADRLEALMDGTITGTVNDAGATTTAFICAGFTPGANDRINGRLLTFTSGALAGEQTDITDWVHATSTITVTALTAAPANGVSFVIS